MKYIISLSFICAVLCSLGYTKQNDAQEDIQTLKNSDEIFDAAVNASDSKTLASLYTNDAVRMPPNRPAWIGYDEILAGFKKRFEENDIVVDNSVEDVRVAGDLAFLRGVFTVKRTPKNGDEPTHDAGKWMAFKQRQPDGSWKTVSDIFNSDQPVSGASLTKQQKVKLAAEVDAAADAWWDCWRTIDVEKGMSFFSDMPEVSWVGDEKNLYGVAAIGKDWKIWAEGLTKQDIEFTDSRTIIVAPNVANTIRNCAYVATKADGSTTPEMTSVETLVWVKQDGQWKILSGHESTLKDSWQTRLDSES